MLACAVEDGDLAANPAAGVRYVPSDHAKRQHPKRNRRELTAADAAATLGAMEERWQAFFLVLAQTGMRIGELLELTSQHVHRGDPTEMRVCASVLP